MDTQQRIDISILNDIYGSLLTTHQSEIIRLYYDRDVSLNEIADEYSISRQAVRDAILRGEKALIDFEAKLHLMQKNEIVSRELEDIMNSTRDVNVKDKISHLIKVVEGE